MFMCPMVGLSRGPSDLSLTALYLIQRLVVEVVEEGELGACQKNLSVALK